MLYGNGQPKAHLVTINAEKLVWRGNVQIDTDASRSIPLGIFAHLFNLDADFHCLQKEISETELNHLANYANVYCWHQELDSFFDTAALIEQVDLVISVDTSVAHLAGEMSKPCWILINYSPDFRWLL